MPLVFEQRCSPGMQSGSQPWLGTHVLLMAHFSVIHRTPSGVSPQNDTKLGSTLLASVALSPHCAPALGLHASGLHAAVSKRAPNGVVSTHDVMPSVQFVCCQLKPSVQVS